MTSDFDNLQGQILVLVTVALGLAFVLALLIPHSWIADDSSGLVRRARAFARAIAVRPSVSLLVVFALAFLNGAANGVVMTPWAAVNDEFAYLLAADTFASGRLANPQHPLFPHFESFAVSHDPVYVSKYPPASAAFMALTQTLFGEPWWGQLLAFALAATAVAWMLRVWVGPRWGTIGGVLVALHPVMQHFARYDYNWSNYSWSHSYWGGSVTMMGAALLFGGVRAFTRHQPAYQAILAAVGIVLLVYSRPFEGLLATIAASLAFIFWATKRRPRLALVTTRIAAPLVVVGLPAIVFLAHYNEATTGDALRLAHQHYADQYGVAAEFLTQEARTPPDGYRNREMAQFYLGWVRPAFLAQQSNFAEYWKVKSEGLEKFAWFYLGWLAPALLGLRSVVSRPWWRMAAAFCAVTVALIFATFEFHPHYAAAAAPLVMALLVAGLAHLWQRHWEWGWLCRLAVLAMLVAWILPRAFDIPSGMTHPNVTDWARTRNDISRDLESIPGRDLVVVSYGDNHSVFQEWVKNHADLDEASIVWARDLGTWESRHRLLDYYADRWVWLVRVDVGQPSVQILRRSQHQRRPGTTPTDVLGPRPSEG